MSDNNCKSALDELYEQLTRDLFAIAKLLFLRARTRYTKLPGFWRNAAISMKLGSVWYYGLVGRKVKNFSLTHGFYKNLTKIDIFTNFVSLGFFCNVLYRSHLQIKVITENLRASFVHLLMTNILAAELSLLDQVCYLNNSQSVL